MFETVDANIQRNHDLWVGMPAFLDAVVHLESGIAVIRQRQAEQAATGDATEKQNARDAAESLLVKIGSQLSALAAKNNDPILGAKVNFDKSTLDKMAVSDLLTTARTVQTEANANAAVLASDYLIPAADLTALGAAIPKLEGLKDAPRLATGSKHVATLSLPSAIRFVRGLLRNEIDKLMEIFKDSQPDFYASHFSARVIVDRPGSHASPKKTSKQAASTPAPTPA
jgi:hypothetical protein